MKKVNVIIDLSEEIAQYVGDTPEEVWRNDEIYQEFGNPAELAWSAVTHLIDYEGDLNGYVENYGCDPRDRRALLSMGDHMRADYLDCWDLYFKEVTHRCGLHLLPYLNLGFTINQFDFVGKSLRVELTDNNERPAYMAEPALPRG